MLPSPSYVPSDDEEEGGGMPASPTHDPGQEDDDDDDAVMLPSPTHAPGEDYDNGEEGGGMPQSPSTDPAAEATGESENYKWYAYYDDEGRTYYYNTETQETSWEEPAEGFHTPPKEDEQEAAVAERNEVAENATETNQVAPEGTTDTAPEESAETTEQTPTAMETEETDTNENGAAEVGSSGWVAYQDDEGREYYYNTETGETQWDKPEGFVEGAAATEEAVATETNEVAQHDMAEPMDTTEGEAPMQQEPEEEEKEEEEEIDPEVLRLQNAQKALEQPDSVLERTCIANVTEVAKSQGGNPESALAKLVENYEGQTAVCGLLGQWLSRLKSSNKASANKERAEISAAVADEIRETIQDVINRIAKENFSKDVGDGILKLSSADASFLKDMINSTRWRKLLIDLSASHKESAVLKLCLRMISEGGFHREIARRINQSDHFSVFHQMLQSELSAIGRLSVSAGSDMSIGFTELVQDLERACTSTSYTYLYALEMIRALIATVDTTQSSPRFRRAVRKWEVLAQILEETLVDPASITSSSSPLFRKRRLDVALTINELHQRQRKRQNNTADNHTYEQALLKFLRRHATGIQVDDSLLDPLLPSGLDLNAGRDVGRLLIEHPLAIRALLGHLYKPGQSRVTNPVTKNKCARLIALSVMAAEEKARAENQTLDDNSLSDEVALTRTILQGAQLCEQLESMISFLVVSTNAPGASSSPQAGQKLVGMAQECAAVAQGVMMWAKEFTKGSEFSGSASFPTLSGCILSLVRVVAIDQPFTRKEAINIAIQFLGHSNSDISYQKVSAIKEQSLRLLVFLMVKGEVVGVLEAVTKLIAKKGSSDLDASLIRYLVGGIVSVVKLPVSYIFAKLFVKLLRSSSCVDAVRSKYFPDERRERLRTLLKFFKNMPKTFNETTNKEDQALFDSAVTMYQVE